YTATTAAGRWEVARRQAGSFGVFGEILQPRQRHRVADTIGAAQLLRPLSPVEADPARRVLSRSFHELLELRHRAAQGERLLDHYRLADREALQRLERLVHLALLRIDVDADEIQQIDDPGR